MDRITTQTGVNITRELVAPTISIVWDYESNTGPITFNIHEVLFVDGVAVQSVPKFALTTSIEEMVARTFNVDLPDGTTTPVPGALVVLAFKKAFQELIAEHS